MKHKIENFINLKIFNYIYIISFLLEFYLKKSINFEICKTFKSNLYLSSNPTKLDHLLNLFYIFFVTGLFLKTMTQEVF